MGTPTLRMLAVGALAIGLVACGGDDDTDTSDGDGSDLGAAIGAAGDGQTSEPSNRGSVSFESTTTTLGTYRRELPDLPPPDIPAEASPPTTVPGTEPLDYPVGFPPDEPGNTVPLIGEIAVDLEPDGYLDFPVSLREGQRVAVISAADDGILTHIEIFRPDGTSEGSWEGGEPEVVNGWAWTEPDDLVPLGGTWVIRVVHLGGGDDPFLIRFFGEP